MNIEQNIKSTKDDFILKLNWEIKKFNSHSYFPLSLKQKTKGLIITTDSILTRGVNSFFEFNTQEDNSFLKVKGKLKMSVFGRVFSGLLIPALLVSLSRFEKDVKLLILLFVFLFLLYGKFFYERKIFKKFLVKLFEDFDNQSTC
jgi:hypothetical protein